MGSSRWFSLLMVISATQAQAAAPSHSLSWLECFRYSVEQVTPRVFRLKHRMTSLQDLRDPTQVPVQKLDEIVKAIPEWAIPEDLREGHRLIVQEKSSPPLEINWASGKVSGGSTHELSNKITIWLDSAAQEPIFDLIDTYSHERFHTTQSRLELRLRTDLTRQEKLEYYLSLERQAFRYQLAVMRYLRGVGIPVEDALLSTIDAWQRGEPIVMRRNPRNLEENVPLNATSEIDLIDHYIEGWALLRPISGTDRFSYAWAAMDYRKYFLEKFFSSDLDPPLR